MFEYDGLVFLYDECADCPELSCECANGCRLGEYEEECDPPVLL